MHSNQGYAKQYTLRRAVKDRTEKRQHLARRAEREFKRAIRALLRGWYR